MKRLLKYLALMVAFATPAAALDLSAMSDDEKDAFGAAVREYLMENPELIIEVIQVLEAKRVADEAQTDRELALAYEDELFNDGYSHISGNADGDIRIVEFIDYRCGYCRKAHPEVKEMVEEDGNISVVYKEYPILGEESVIAARIAITTRNLYGGQTYEDMQDALMAFSGSLTEAGIRRLADAVDVDADAILTTMTMDEISNEINRNRVLGNAMAITGTPTFVAEQEMLRGYVPKDRFVSLVDILRKQ